MWFNFIYTIITKNVETKVSFLKGSHQTTESFKVMMMLDIECLQKVGKIQY